MKIVNTCLDYCSNNQSYACLSLCVSGRKNEAATKVTLDAYSLWAAVRSLLVRCKNLQLGNGGQLIWLKKLLQINDLSIICLPIK